MLEYSLAQLLTPIRRKPPGLVPYVPYVKENSVIAQNHVPKSKAPGGKKMLKLEQKTATSHWSTSSLTVRSGLTMLVKMDGSS